MSGVVVVRDHKDSLPGCILRAGWGMAIPKLSVDAAPSDCSIGRSDKNNLFYANRCFSLTFQLKLVQPLFKSIDLANAVISVSVLFQKNVIRHKTWWDVLFFGFFDFSIPRAPSRSNHYVDKVGGYHKMLICTLNSPNAFPWIETCPFMSIRVGPSSPSTRC